MQDILLSENVRNHMTDPEILEWVLEELGGLKERDMEAALAVEEYLFTQPILTHWVEHAEGSAASDFFGLLSGERLALVTDEIVAHWPSQSGEECVISLKRLDQIAPEKALRLCEEFIAGEMDDFAKATSVARTLVDHPDATREALAHQFAEKLGAPECGLGSDLTRGLRAMLGGTYSIPSGEQAIAETLLDESPLHERLDPLQPLFAALAQDTFPLDQIEAMQDDDTSQSFISLQVLFEDGAPLAELDDLLTTDKAVTWQDTLLFLREHCANRGYRPLELVGPGLSRDPASFSEEDLPQYAAFYLALGAASWRRTQPCLDQLSTSEAVSLLAADLWRHPAGTELVEVLAARPAEEVVECVMAELPEVEDHCGILHLMALMRRAPDARYAAPMVQFVEDEDAEGPEGTFEVLMALGEPAEAALREAWDELDEWARLDAVTILARINPALALECLLEVFPDVRQEGLEPWCATAVLLPHPRVLEVLAPELKRRDDEADRTFYIVATVLGENHPELPEVRKRVAQARAERAKWGLRESLEGPPPEYLRLELKCRSCGDASLYDVYRVIVNPQDEHQQPFIGDELTCLSCGTVDQLDLTARGHATVLSELMAMANCGSAERIADSPVQLAIPHLTDGRNMSPADAIKHYEEAVRKRPDDVLAHLSLGNCYSTIGRDHRAKPCYEACIRLDPTCVEAAYGLAQILEDEEKPLSAYGVLDDALKYLGKWRPQRIAKADRDEFIEAYLEMHEALMPPWETKRGGPLPAMLSTPETRPAKVGPNDRCPCGSGKKYKKCCGRLGG